MLKCKKCGKEFPNWINIDGKKRNLCKRKFCLECSPFGKHNTRDLTKSGRKHKILNYHKIYKGEGHARDKYGHMRYIRKCRECGQFKAIRAHEMCATCYQRNLRMKKSKQIKIEFGGKCVICDYNKCYQALCFHHLDPTKKKFQVTGYSTITIEKMRREAKKCILVCANCHAEIHAGVIKIPAGLM